MSIWKEILAASGGTAAIIGVVVWLTKSIIANYLTKDVEIYKTRIKAESDKDIEKFKSDLKKIAFEHEIQFSRLHEKRMELISELYSKMYNVRMSTSGLIYHFETPNMRDKRYLVEFSEAISGLMSHFGKHRIYFNEDTCSIIDKFIAKISIPSSKIIEFENQPRGVKINVEKLSETYNEAQKAIEDFDLSEVLKIIENEFRELLSVDKDKNIT